MALTPIKKTITLKDQAYNAIKQAIYSNTLTPGSPLTEEQLSASLSISRTPIRSALQQLVFDKLAITDNTGHIFVSHITEKDVHDISVLRLNLEPLAIELSTLPIHEDIINHILDIIQQQELLVQEEDAINNVRFAELDCEFHCALSTICDNSVLSETIESINTRMIRILILSGTLHSFKSNALAEHKMIVKYLQNGQKEFAKVALQEHLKIVEARMLP